jgi:hypothetical protein
MKNLFPKNWEKPSSGKLTTHIKHQYTSSEDKMQAKNCCFFGFFLGQNPAAKPALQSEIT